MKCLCHTEVIIVMKIVTTTMAIEGVDMHIIHAPPRPAAYFFHFYTCSPIVMFRIMSPFVINVPTRYLLVPDTKRSFQIMVGTLALQLQ